MPDWIAIVLLGIIEGITEFLPISSTGHLLIAEHWLPRQSDLFNIVVQSGAVLAVLPLFKDRLVMLSRFHEWESRSMLAKIVFAFLITAVGGVVLEKKHFKLPEELLPVAWALLIGGILFIAVEQWLRTRQPASQITWVAAGVVGAAQLIAAVFPGASRSGSTIIFALILGIGRVAATEFSFLVGIPTLLAAGALKTFKALHHPAPDAPHEDWAMLGLASVVAAVVSFIAVKWLLRYVQTHTFNGFGLYRIVLGIVLLVVVYTSATS